MNELELNLVWLYPDILNLHGDRANVQAFQKVADNLGVALKVTRINDYSETIDFKTADIILGGPGELKVIPQVKQALERQKEALEEYIQENKYLICIGTTGSLLAKEIKRENGETIEGLGILDMTGEERKMVIGDDLHYTIAKTKQEIIGSQIHMVDFAVSKEQALGTTIYGNGNNGTGIEGARDHNVIFTNCLGPVFVKNPWWAEAIIKNAILNKQGILAKAEYDLEDKSFETTKRFIKQKPKM